MADTRNQYWATLAADELAPEAVSKVEKYFQNLEETGMMRKFYKSYQQYFGHSSASGSGLFSSSVDVGSAGEQGELSTVKIGHYRNLIQHLLVMTTSQRPALEARASNTDMKSQAQTMLANGVLDYYMREKRIERLLKSATEHALLFGEGYIHLTWDSSLGEPVAVDPTTSTPIMEGDIKYSLPFGPLEVIKDVGLNDIGKNEWYIVRELVNKFHLAAQFPEKRDEILALNNDQNSRTSASHFMPTTAKDSVYIPQYTLYHKRCPSLEEGREFRFLSGKLWLMDGPLPTTNLPGGLPIFRISPSDFFGTGFGYTPAWDIIGIGEVIDMLYSTVTTNHATFGVQVVLAPRNSDINYQQLGEGLSLVEYDPKLGKPESLNLTNTPPEIFKFMAGLEELEQKLLGINNVVRGNPEASLKSGSALALMASQAIQFNSGLQASYTALLEDIGTATIKLLQTFANTKRVASIAGKSQRYMLKQFSSEDLDQINRVVVDVANPMSRTLAGRLEMAQNLLQVPGLLKSPDQYLQVIETGKLQPMVEGKEAELMLIRSENEMMADGQLPPSPVATERHSLHIDEHSAVLSSPDAKLTPGVIEAATQHILEHLNQLRTADPGLLMMRGEQPLPPLPPPGFPAMPPPGSEEPAPGPRGPAPTPSSGPPRPDGAPSAPQLNDSTPPVVQQGQSVKMPNMPTNPLTHQKAPGSPTAA